MKKKILMKKIEMKFKIIHKNGKEKIIKAKNLEEAEIKANKIWKAWIDIILLK